MKQKILIVEDEPNLGLTLLDYLNDKGWPSKLATRVSEALEIYQEFGPEIVLLDIGLPDGNGIDLAKELIKDSKDLAIVFLSALNDPDIKLQGLELGGYDYITKPFNLKELLLRLERITPLIKIVPSEVTHGPLTIKFDSYQIVDALGNTLDLGQKECAILQLLYKNKGKVLNRDEILKVVWGEEAYPSNRTVDNYIVKIRKLCESDKGEHIKITNIRGVGYKLEIK